MKSAVFIAGISAAGVPPARPRSTAMVLWILAVLCASSAPCLAQSDPDGAAPSIGQLKQLNLEDLMNVQVTSVARRPQKLLDTASAIQVITQDDIRRSGATSLPEALRLADNLEVAQKNSHDWAISARGFNTALANKLLVMIDGRTVYTPLFSGVFWDIQDYPLADIDRIEVISGPGGTLWGANAVNGVINIITKSATATQGLSVEAGAGSELKDSGTVRYGGVLAPDTDFRIYGKYFERGDEALPNGDPAFDAWRQARGGFRIDSKPSAHDDLTLQGDIYDGREDVTSGNIADTEGGNVLGRWTRTLSNGSTMTLQSYFDQANLTDPIAPLVFGTLRLTPAGFLQDNLTTYDVDFQHRIALDTRNSLIWGLGFRYTHDMATNAPSLGFFPPTLNQDLYSAFVQDEIRLRSNLALTLGSKLEHNDYTGFEFEPDVRLRWTLTPDQTMWSAVSRAVRTPSRVDRDESEGSPPYFVLLKGGADFMSETVIAYELGYRAQINSRLSTSVSTYYNVYDDVRSTSFTPGTILPLFFANNLEGDTYGLEYSSDFRVTDAWSLHAGYTLLREHLHVKAGATDINGALNETADPEHQFSLRSSLNLPRHIEFSNALRWVDTLHINSGTTIGTVPSYFELDTHLSWRASDRLELSLVGQNLLHNYHPEYGFPSPDRVEIQRSVYGKLTWRY
ncbi:MAG TPA: TonB-dependent receptor [Steroidobacteraceae bacterium]